MTILTACLLLNVVLGQGGGGGGGSGSGDSGEMGAVFWSVFGGVLGILGILLCIFICCSCGCCETKMSTFRENYLEKKRKNVVPEKEFDKTANNFRTLINEVISGVKKLTLLQRSETR